MKPDAEFLRKSIEGFLASTRTNFERDGQLMPIAIMLVQKMPDGSPATQMPFGLIPAFLPLVDLMRSQSEKDLAAEAIRQLCHIQAAVLVMVITECWTVEMRGKAKDSPEVKGAMEAGARGELHKHPERREAVTAMVEGIHGINEIHRAFIERKEGEPPHLGPWQALSARMGLRNEGRFSGFIRPDADA